MTVCISKMDGKVALERIPRHSSVWPSGRGPVYTLQVRGELLCAKRRTECAVDSFHKLLEEFLECR